MRNYTKSTMFSLSPLLESRNCVLHLRTMLNLQRIQKKFSQTLRLDALSIPNYVMKKGPNHGARHGKTEEQKEYHMAWNAWKRYCKKVDSQGEHFLQVFTIDSSEIQFIVNHSSHSDGQNKSAKRWEEIAKEDHTYRLTPEEKKRYQGQWVSYLEQSRQK